MNGQAIANKTILFSILALGCSEPLQVRTDPSVPLDRYSANRLWSNSRPLNGIRFSNELDRVYAYFSVESVFNGISDVTVNAVRPLMVKSSAVPRAGGGLSVCLELQLDSTLVCGTRVSVDIHSKDGAYYTGIARALPVFAVGTTQYDHPLRIERVDFNGRFVVLSVYNESNWLKPELSIERVVLDGKDVTGYCDLPDKPLPADRHSFLDDVRQVKIPLPDAAALDHEIELFYALQTKNSSEVGSSVEFGCTDLKVRQGLKLPIGLSNGCTLRDSVCLQWAGLRPSIELQDFYAQSNRVLKHCADLPIYAHILEGAAVNEIATRAIGCDFVVVCAGVPSDSSGFESNADWFIAFHDTLEAISTPYISAVTRDGSRSLSADTLDWRSRVALGSGSAGLCLTRPIERTGYATDVLSRAKEFEECEDQLRALFGFARSWPVICRVEEPGIHVSALQAGPNSLVLCATNLWNSNRSDPVGTCGIVEPFYCYTRNDVHASVNLGKDWPIEGAFDIGTGRRVNFTQDTDGVATFLLPKLSLGSFVLLERKASSETELRKILPIRCLEDKHSKKELSLVPANSPIVHIGLVEPGEERDYLMPIINRSDNDANIEVCLERSAETRHASLQLLNAKSLEIGAGDQGILQMQLRAPNTEGISTARIRISIDEDDSDSIPVFINARVAKMVRWSPPMVDFGSFLQDQGAKEQQVSFRSAKGRFSILSVKSVDESIEYRLDSERQSFTCRPRRRVPGRFSSRLLITGKIEDEDRLRRVEIPFQGNALARWKCIPERFVLAQSGIRAIKRKLVIRNSARAKFRVLSADFTPPIGRVTRASNEPAIQHEISVLITTVSALEGTIHLECLETETEINHSIDIPVRIIENEASDENASGQSVKSNFVFSDLAAINIEDLIERVGKVANDFREHRITSGAPNWVRMHALLPYGGRSPSMPRVEENRASLFESVLRPPNTRYPPFVVRRNAPFPQQDGLKFDQEHHRDQFLFLLAMGGVDLDEELRVASSVFTVRDLVDNSKAESNSRGELSKTVGAHAFYCDPSETSWKNKFGQEQSLAGLAAALLKSEADEKLCGGTHRLCAIAILESRQILHEEQSIKSLLPQLRHEFGEAMADLRRNQVTNGSFALPASLAKVADSNIWINPNVASIHYSGHSLEWMSIALSGEELTDEWILVAVQYLCDAIAAEYPASLHQPLAFRSDLDCFSYGIACHAVSGLERWSAKVQSTLRPKTATTIGPTSPSIKVSL